MALRLEVHCLRSDTRIHLDPFVLSTLAHLGIHAVIDAVVAEERRHG